MATRKHEIWQDDEDCCISLIPVGTEGEWSRSRLAEDAKLLGVIEGNSYFETMTRYYEFMDWGEYKYPPEWEDVKDPYPPE
jgi:hypothetical protein